jgi:hypothetical protein
LITALKVSLEPVLIGTEGALWRSADPSLPVVGGI